MGRSTPPPKPWIHHSNQSTSSLTGSGMELSIPPNRKVHSSSPSLSEYSNKALPPPPPPLPPSPKSPIYKQHNNRIEPPPRSPRRQFQTEKRPERSVVDPRQTKSTSVVPKVKTKLPPPPQTPMSKSSRKVLQLTGFNPNYERTFLDDLHLYDASSSDLSSESTYSHEAEVTKQQGFQAAQVDAWKVMHPILTPLQTDDSQYFLQSKVYSSSESSIQHPESKNVSRAPSLRSLNSNKNISSAPSIPSRAERSDEAQVSPINPSFSRKPGSHASSIQSRRQQKKTEQQQRQHHHHEFQNTSHFVTTPTYEDLVARERARLGIDNECDDEDLDYPVSPDHVVSESALSPRPLEIRPKKRLEVRPMSHFSDHSSSESINKKQSILSSARESFATGMRELSSPTKPRHTTSPGLSSPRSMPPPPPPLLSKSKRKRDFATGNHPLKSPFPFRSPNRTSGEIRRRVSGAMKRISGSGPTRETPLITNSERSADGPDTPLPKASGGMFMKTLHDSADVLQKGNSQFLGVVKKAKKTVRVRSPSEKRRDDLKKTITVIGHSDQTPDGRVAEWV